MASEQKIAANRRNAEDSTGPRTRGGRARASRNALRHGLSAALDHGHQGEKVERIARLIAGKDRGDERYQQAIIIAECSLSIARIRLFRAAAIERFRERMESPFFAGSPLPQEVDGLARLHGLGNSRAVGDVIGRLCKATVAGFKDLKAGMKDLRRGDAARIIALSDGFEKGAPEPRNDADCFLLAFSELRALERYERRALSRRRRAMRIFDALSVSARGSGTAARFRNNIL